MMEVFIIKRFSNKEQMEPLGMIYWKLIAKEL